MVDLAVDFVHGVASDSKVLEAAGIADADTALILANDPAAVESDDLSTSICAVIKRVNPKVRTIIEKVRHDDTIFEIANADTVVEIAPPSVLAQEVLDPGAIELQNAIFSTMIRGTQFNCTYHGSGTSWAELATALLQRDTIPEGFRNPGQSAFNLLPRRDDPIEHGAMIKYRGIELIQFLD
jgi:Trk K+ transport system NAD-binding subunit